MHRANEIRPLMKRISVLAEKYQCAIILIGHMNKNSNGKSSYRGLGSIDFQAAARSVLIVGRVKDEPEIRVICHVKSSLCSGRRCYRLSIRQKKKDFIGLENMTSVQRTYCPVMGEGKRSEVRKNF